MRLPVITQSIIILALSDGTDLLVAIKKKKAKNQVWAFKDFKSDRIGRVGGELITSVGSSIPAIVPTSSDIS